MSIKSPLFLAAIIVAGLGFFSAAATTREQLIEKVEEEHGSYRRDLSYIPESK